MHKLSCDRGACCMALNGASWPYLLLLAVKLAAVPVAAAPVEWQIASVMLPVSVVAEQLECVLVEFVVAAVLIEQLGAVRLLGLALLLGLEPD